MFVFITAPTHCNSSHSHHHKQSHCEDSRSGSKDRHSKLRTDKKLQVDKNVHLNRSLANVNFTFVHFVQTTGLQQEVSERK
jgi:hypothetical protein